MKDGLPSELTVLAGGRGGRGQVGLFISGTPSAGRLMVAQKSGCAPQADGNRDNKWQQMTAVACHGTGPVAEVVSDVWSALSFVRNAEQGSESGINVFSRCRFWPLASIGLSTFALPIHTMQ